MTNERTSKRVASIAARILQMDLDADLWIKGTNGRWHRLLLTWSEVRLVAASALTQAADKPLRVDRQPAPKRRPYDDRGFDPRDGGKIGREHVPRQRKSKRGRS